jgi:hypothetical protein
VVKTQKNILDALIRQLSDSNKVMPATVFNGGIDTSSSPLSTLLKVVDDLATRNFIETLERLNLLLD